MNHQKHNGKTRSDWQALIDQQAQSGLSISDFCKNHQLSVGTFYNWRSNLTKKPAGFTKLSVVQQPEPPGKIRCFLPSGLRLEWDETVDTETITSILKALP